MHTDQTARMGEGEGHFGSNTMDRDKLELSEVCIMLLGRSRGRLPEGPVGYEGGVLEAWGLATSVSMLPRAGT